MQHILTVGSILLNLRLERSSQMHYLDALSFMFEFERTTRNDANNLVSMETIDAESWQIRSNISVGTFHSCTCSESISSRGGQRVLQY